MIFLLFNNGIINSKGIQTELRCEIQPPMAWTSSEHILEKEVVLREAKVWAEAGELGRSGHGDKERASLPHVSRGNARLGSWGVGKGEGQGGRGERERRGRKGRWALSPPLNSTHSLIFSILDILVRPAPDPSRGAGSETRSFFAFPFPLAPFVPFPSVPSLSGLVSVTLIHSIFIPYCKYVTFVLTSPTSLLFSSTFLSIQFFTFYFFLYHFDPSPYSLKSDTFRF